MGSQKASDDPQVGNHFSRCSNELISSILSFPWPPHIYHTCLLGHFKITIFHFSHAPSPYFSQHSSLVLVSHTVHPMDIIYQPLEFLFILLMQQYNFQQICSYCPFDSILFQPCTSICLNQWFIWMGQVGREPITYTVYNNIGLFIFCFHITIFYLYFLLYSMYIDTC